MFSYRDRASRAASMLCSFFVFLNLAFAQNSFLNDAKHFQYDRQQALDVKEVSVQRRGNVTIHDLTYASPKGGRVPAYLIVPETQGKFAAIIWGHWMMPKSATANRGEFIAEALALAPAGAVSLLIDTPQLRPGFNQDPDPLGSQQTEVLAQQVVDLRRGLDLLLARNDIDGQRVAYVGHSFDSGAGAILDALDKRFKAFVLMGGPISVRDFVLSGDSPDIAAFRKSVPAEKLRAYLDTYAWADPATYAAHFGPAPALLQYATHDPYAPTPDARKFFAMCAGPKEMKLYDSGHSLNREARRDRVNFLQSHLALRKLAPGAVDNIPETK
jgi:cephalosporin-C deacetylase-like acetyl esterase